MRTRADIEDQIKAMDWRNGLDSRPSEPEHKTNVLIEVSLDIRDLLREILVELQYLEVK